MKLTATFVVTQEELKATKNNMLVLNSKVRQIFTALVKSRVFTDAVDEMMFWEFGNPGDDKPEIHAWWECYDENGLDKGSITFPEDLLFASEEELSSYVESLKQEKMKKEKEESERFNKMVEDRERANFKRLSEKYA